MSYLSKVKSLNKKKQKNNINKATWVSREHLWRVTTLWSQKAFTVSILSKLQGWRRISKVDSLWSAPNKTRSIWQTSVCIWNKVTSLLPAHLSECSRVYVPEYTRISLERENDAHKSFFSLKTFKTTSSQLPGSKCAVRWCALYEL